MMGLAASMHTSSRMHVYFMADVINPCSYDASKYGLAWCCAQLHAMLGAVKAVFHMCRCIKGAQDTREGRGFRA